MLLTLCCTKYFALYPHTICHIWDVNEEEILAIEVERGCTIANASSIL